MDYGISSDWVFFILAICKYGCSYQHVDLPIAVCNRDGISCKPENLNRIVANKEKLLQKEFSLFYKEHQMLRAGMEELKGFKSSRYYRIYKKLKSLLNR